jgi:hypothetical protein
MIIELLFRIIAIYLISGFVFAIAFIFKGVDQVDEGAHGSSIGFKIIIIPGTIVFWPLLLKKWLNVSKEKHHD